MVKKFIKNNNLINWILKILEFFNDLGTVFDKSV